MKVRNEVKAVIDRLKVVRIKVQGYLDNVGEGQDEREDALSNEVDCLDEAIGALEGID